MNHPKISVYVPSHNYGSFLSEAIESVLRQNFDDWELLLIDDNSSDNTPEIMNCYRGDERIRIFRTEGIGLIRVCNLAIKESRGEYIIRLDGDDIFDENILLILSNYLDRHPEIALVFPDYYLMDEFGDIFAEERRQKIYNSNHMLDAPPNGACFLARRQILLNLGGYREDLIAQDGYYIWLKLLGEHKCANVNLPLFYYRRHGSNLTNKQQRIFAARRDIKRKEALTELDNYRPLIAVIPCRRNYDFRIDLWNQLIEDKTLLKTVLYKCLKSSLFDKIIIACDNPEAEQFVQETNDSRVSFFLREQRETVRSESVVRTLDRIVSLHDPKYQGITVLSYIQAPFTTIDTLEEAIFTLIVNQADSAVSVEEMDRPIFKRSPFGLTAINPPNGISSDFHTVYAEVRSVLAARNHNFMTGSLLGPRVVNFVLSHEESFFINSERNLEIATILASKKNLSVNSPS